MAKTRTDQNNMHEEIKFKFNAC